MTIGKCIVEYLVYIYLFYTIIASHIEIKNMFCLREE